MNRRWISATGLAAFLPFLGAVTCKGFPTSVKGLPAGRVRLGGRGRRRF
ncbi:hypothetical protein GA0115233_11495 [Streptomyces sp. DI166]|nr:hypothetical protein GA0115233_11495 [Streptomyces sp. DI166]